MKKFIIVTLILSLIFCFSSYLNAKKKVFIVKVKLDKVIREPELAKEFEIENGKRFGDEILDIIWEPSPSGFYFELLNKLSSSISIIWDECSFIDKNFDSHKVIHEGVKYKDAEQTVLPSTIPLLAKKSDLVFPSDYIYFGIEKRWTLTGEKTKWTFYSKTEQWNKIPIYFSEISEKEVKNMKKYEPHFDLSKYIENQNFRVVLVLKENENKYSYHFFFKSYLKED